jgi:hypothetical protein
MEEEYGWAADHRSARAILADPSFCGLCRKGGVCFMVVLWRVVKYLPSFHLAAACYSYSHADTLSFKGLMNRLEMRITRR